MPRRCIQHYDIYIKPENCPRRVNREIIEIMVQAYSQLFGNLRPAFDGRNNLYTRDILPIEKKQVKLEVGFFF